MRGRHRPAFGQAAQECRSFCDRCCPAGTHQLGQPSRHACLLVCPFGKPEHVPRFGGIAVKHPRGPSHRLEATWIPQRTSGLQAPLATGRKRGASQEGAGSGPAHLPRRLGSFSSGSRSVAWSLAAQASGAAVCQPWGEPRARPQRAASSSRRGCWARTRQLKTCIGAFAAVAGEGGVPCVALRMVAAGTDSVHRLVRMRPSPTHAQRHTANHGKAGHPELISFVYDAHVGFFPFNH